MNICLPLLCQLKGINSLTWFPWIGEEYLHQSPKILILGESHYCYNNCSTKEIETNREETKSVVEDYVEKGREAGNQYKTYEAMENVLRQVFDPFKGTNRQEIWSKICYMNIIQKCMDNNRERPHWQYFLSGWQTVIQVINVLKPDICICFSTDKMKNRNNFNRLEEFKSQALFTFSIQHTHDTQKRLSRCIVATPGAITIDNLKEIPVIFVQHASRIRDINGWANVIKKSLSPISI